MALFHGGEVKTELTCIVLVAQKFLPRLGCLEIMVLFVSTSFFSFVKEKVIFIFIKMVMRIFQSCCNQEYRNWGRDGTNRTGEFQPRSGVWRGAVSEQMESH